MNDITCPHCDQKFEIDAAGYADIVKQVRGAEFESEIHERLKEAEERHLIQIELAKKEVMEEEPPILLRRRRGSRNLRTRLAATRQS